MATHRTAAAFLTVLAACGALQLHAAGPSVAITGATLIDGTGAQPIRDAVIVVSDGRIAAAGIMRAGPKAVANFSSRDCVLCVDSDKTSGCWRVDKKCAYSCAAVSARRSRG